MPDWAQLLLAGFGVWLGLDLIRSWWRDQR